ncbi:proton-conducting transporter membrane subunit [Microbulbifer sp. A4B17]|uniref:proton-conducting transporter transmembrane domain-containing protein n=1 Tax=Microbulbifer sp. A4B17 TaxID=359370 RepID=UPI002107C3D5|nr:proton-conducting transporter membrane subunit [Microbulbifer sp. A4B17]
MFLALGVGAWSGAIFHLMTHAFFKALLFLSAGSVILSVHHEQNIFAMGGLYRKIPFTFICFTIGCACLAALPFTSGFYSKDHIYSVPMSTTRGSTCFGLPAYWEHWLLAFIASAFSFSLSWVVRVALHLTAKTPIIQ